MKIRTFFAFAGCVFFTLSVAAAAVTSPQPFPSALLPITSYVFEEVIDGTKITHDFVILNKGTAPLKIFKVQTS